MRKLVLLSILVFSITKGEAQRNNHLFFEVGNTIPVGSFRSTTRDDAAFAKSGNGVVLGYYHNFKRLYVGLQSAIFSYDFNTSAYDKLIEKEVGGGATSVTTHSGYALISAQLILGLDFYKDSLLSIGGHIKPGVALYLSDNLDNVTKGNGKTVESTLDSYSEGSKIFALGVQARYKAVKKASVIGGIDYYFGRPVGTTQLRQKVNGTTFINNSLTKIETKYRSLYIFIGLSIDF